MRNFETIANNSHRRLGPTEATKKCLICEFEVGHHPQCPEV